MGFKKRNVMKLSHDSLRSILQKQLNRMFVSEEIVVSKIEQDGEYFDVEFYSAKETIAPGTDLPLAIEIIDTRQKAEVKKNNRELKNQPL